MSKGGNVDLSKWSKDDFSTGLIPDYIDCKYFASKPVTTNNFGLCFSAKEKFYRHFLVTTFFHLATEKKKKLVASWHLPKKVNFKTLLLTIDFIGLYMQVPLCKQGFGTDKAKLSISFTKWQKQDQYSIMLLIIY